jgi:hypothetical protein
MKLAVFVVVALLLGASTFPSEVRADPQRVGLEKVPVDVRALAVQVSDAVMPAPLPDQALSVDGMKEVRAKAELVALLANGYGLAHEGLTSTPQLKPGDSPSGRAMSDPGKC